MFLTRQYSLSLQLFSGILYVNIMFRAKCNVCKGLFIKISFHFRQSCRMYFILLETKKRAILIEKSPFVPCRNDSKLNVRIVKIERTTNAKPDKPFQSPLIESQSPRRSVRSLAKSSPSRPNIIPTKRSAKYKAETKTSPQPSICLSPRVLWWLLARALSRRSRRCCCWICARG